MPHPAHIREKALESRDAIELLSNKWRVPILHILRDGALRTGEIHAAITEVSAKVLTQTLRAMERDGLLERQVLRLLPPHVEYNLTPMGESLIEPLRQLCLWAKVHVAERNSARLSFDQKEKVPIEQPAFK